MSTAVIDDSDCLTQVLSDIQAENTDATSLDDLMRTFDVIRKSPGGFARVNEQVKKGIREWNVDELEKPFSIV